MVEYKVVHIGINAANAEEAVQAAKMFETLFGLPVKEGSNSVYAGTAVEVMKTPRLGKSGHIGIGTPDVAAAQAELEAKGFSFLHDTAKRKPDGTLSVIYLKDEICGFAVHLVVHPDKNQTTYG